MVRVLLALVVLLATFAPALLPAKQVFACSCAAPDPQGSLDNADVVVVGTVDAIAAPQDRPDGSWSSMDPVSFTVSTEKYLKGIGGPTLAGNTARSSVSCGALDGLEAGERHLLFLQAEDGAYTTGLCDGNRQLTGFATHIEDERERY